MEDILVSKEGGICSITLARIGQKNALNYSAHERLDGIFTDFENDPDLGVAIISSACAKVFCAGQDLKEFAESNKLEFPPGGFGGLTSRLLRKPVIAAVDGLALGGGFELAMACDIVVASSSARFGLPESLVGLAPLAGGIQRLIRAVGHQRAMAIMMTGRRIPADEALSWGLVNEVVDDQPLVAARRWADDILKSSPLAIAAIKQIAAHSLEEPLWKTVQSVWEQPAVADLLGSDHPSEGARAFIGRRAPEWSKV
jgi:crotonobetainyl-CoA hydratase